MAANFDWVTTSQSFGFIGPGDPAVHIEHTLAFGTFVETLGVPLECGTPFSYADLGTGGGFPGLYICQAGSISTGALIEVRKKRAEFLEGVLDQLGLADKMRVLCERTERLAHTELREGFDLITARAFGAPSVTAESGSGLLALGGLLVISDPPGTTSQARWSSEGLAMLGLEHVASVSVPFALTALRKVVPLDERYPRRTGLPERKPLF